MSSARIVAGTLILALGSGSAAFAGAERYNDASSPEARPEVVRRVEALVAEIARKERREVPVSEPRLERAADEIARHAPPDGRPPNELVQSALWLFGLVEPPPHLIVVSRGEGSDDALAAELRQELPRALTQGRYRRIGVGMNTAGMLVIALQESFVSLEPIPRSLPSGGPAWLRGRLLGSYQRPEGFVTGPDGRVTRLSVAGDATRFEARMQCGPTRGRYQVELTGDDRYGPAVVANFPIYCGAPAPNQVVTRAPADDRFSDAADAEAKIFAQVNADRQRAGMPPLALDPRLRAVAAAHSADMHAHGFVGHLSPSTGDAQNRVRSAGIDAQLVLENVARAYSPGEAERGLMESPGHRANLLNRDATKIGIGVVVSESTGGVRELLVTQVFIRPPDAIDAGSPAELKRRIDALRHSYGRSLLGRDADLDSVAQVAARDLARGALTADRAGEPMERALRGLSARYRTVRSVVAVSRGLDQVVKALTDPLIDPTSTTCGIGLAVGAPPGKLASLYAIIVLATRR